MVAKVKPSPLIVIVGPTAAGKSELAIKVAKKFNGEIICADSWTIRKKLDVGTAKPSHSDQKLIKHHLLDIIEPDQKFSAAEFKLLCNRAIEDIASRNKLPIMVGGSGLYIDGVIFDYSFVQTDTSNREDLNKLSAKGLVAVINKSKLSLAGVDINNRRRLIRVIEKKGKVAGKKSLRPNTLIIGIYLPKEKLEDRIKNRTQTMLDNGLEVEVRELSANYGWQSEALKGINYYEWQNYLKGLETIEILQQKLNQDNLKLAKKQMTWFRKNKSIQWETTPVKWSNVVDLITTFMSN